MLDFAFLRSLGHGPRWLLAALVGWLVLAMRPTLARSCHIEPPEPRLRTYAWSTEVKARIDGPQPADPPNDQRRKEALRSRWPWNGAYVEPAFRGPLVVMAWSKSETDPTPVIFARERPTVESLVDLVREYPAAFGAPKGVSLMVAPEATREERLLWTHERADASLPDHLRNESWTELEQVFAEGVRCFECRIRFRRENGKVTQVQNDLATNSDTLDTAPRTTPGEAREAFQRQHLPGIVLHPQLPTLRVFVRQDRVARLAWTLVYYFRDPIAWSVAIAEIDPTTLEWIRDLRVVDPDFIL
ncbi:MAG: hypothetical protein IPK71_01345 [Myxococcales bacterium]|nr:hypothetical protein [Myxococcales bacterium]